jgi:putative methyltransferase
MKIQLGTISVIHETWLPYAAGCLISYCNKIPAIKNKFTFLEPLYKYKPLEEYNASFNQTDIFGLTCYVWNQAYNDQLMQHYKSINPKGITMYGGPNVPEDPKLAQKFADERPWIDIFWVGPGEKLISSFLLNIDKPLDYHDGSFGRTWNKVEVGRKLYQIDTDEMPTPYIDGVFDDILRQEKRVKASFETNRGCPFKCAFCDWGGQARSKVTKFDMDPINDQLNFIYNNTNIAELEILDANFGMLPRDLDVVKNMRANKQRTGNNPKISYSGLAKNGSKWLPEIIDIIHHDLDADQRNLKVSFQTHSAETLKTINRDNIDNDKLIPLIEGFKAKGLPVTSEMIIALPGETADSWLYSLQRDYELGIDFMRTYFLNLVPNTEIYTDEFKQKYDVKSKILAFPYSFSGLGYKKLHLDPEYRDERSTYEFEEIEIMHRCHSYDQDEIVKMFDYWWFYHNFHNSRALSLTMRDLFDTGHDIQFQATWFYKHLDKMPFMNQLVQKNRQIINTIFADEPRTEVKDLATYLYFSRCLRSDEIYQFWHNQEKFVADLSQVYPAELVEKDVADWKKEFDMSMYGTDARIKPQEAVAINNER